MTYETTLETVRELAERATIRPAPKYLRFTRPDEPRGPRPAIIAWEELHPPAPGGSNTPHQHRDRDRLREGRGESPRGICLNCGAPIRQVTRDLAGELVTAWRHQGNSYVRNDCTQPEPISAADTAA